VTNSTNMFLKLILYLTAKWCFRQYESFGYVSGGCWMICYCSCAIRWCTCAASIVVECGVTLMYYQSGRDWL
jgi:hypothetical protein